MVLDLLRDRVSQSSELARVDPDMEVLTFSAGMQKRMLDRRW